jgi:hypothetical protein
LQAAGDQRRFTELRKRIRLLPIAVALGTGLGCGELPVLRQSGIDFDERQSSERSDRSADAERRESASTTTTRRMVAKASEQTKNP